QSFLQKSRKGASYGTMITSGGTIHARLLNSTDEELSAVSIWALTLGVFALLTFGLTAVPSIICGHVALSRTRAGRPSSLARSVAFLGLLIGYVGVAILGAWLVVMVRYLVA
ncbi:MAG: DUF4190 domain-containing protein, partial [Chthoniobacterales bacterium]